MYKLVIYKMYIFVVSCSGRNMDNTELLKFKDPKFYNNPEQYDEFLRYVFTSYPGTATVTSSRPFHHFRWHCQHCFFPASSPVHFKAHTSDCPGGKDNISVFCGHCGHIYITREQLHIHANRYGFHTQHSRILNYSIQHHWPRLSSPSSPSVSVRITNWNNGIDRFRRDLKTHLFEWHCVSFSALAVFSHNALYKSTFYLLTFLLTTLPTSTAPQTIVVWLSNSVTLSNMLYAWFHNDRLLFFSHYICHYDIFLLLC